MEGSRKFHKVICNDNSWDKEPFLMFSLITAKPLLIISATIITFSFKWVLWYSKSQYCMYLIKSLPQIGAHQAVDRKGQRTPSFEQAPTSYPPPPPKKKKKCTRELLIITSISLLAWKYLNLCQWYITFSLLLLFVVLLQDKLSIWWK